MKAKARKTPEAPVADVVADLPTPPAAEAPAAPAGAAKAPRYVLTEKVTKVRRIATKQEPEKGHGKEWRDFAATDDSIRYRVMARLQDVFTGVAATEAELAEALKGMHLGRRTHTAYARLLVVRGYVAEAKPE